MYRLILLRHGESVWNQENRFTGWTDVDLSERGRGEAEAAGHSLREAGLAFDLVFTSVLKRAIRTAWIVADSLDRMWVPIQRDWRLNERHYGALQGLNKSETANKFGADQVQLWRRGYAIRPPALSDDDPRHPRRDPRYAQLPQNLLPSTESLEDTEKRFWAVWQESIEPAIRLGKEVLIAAHNNSLRSLIKHLDRISETDIVKLDIPTGIPLIYELDRDLRPLNHHYLPSRKSAAQLV